MVSESRTSAPILVFLDLSVLDLGPMYATDRQTSDTHYRLMHPYGAGHNNIPTLQRWVWSKSLNKEDIIRKLLQLLPAVDDGYVKNHFDRSMHDMHLLCIADIGAADPRIKCPGVVSASARTCVSWNDACVTTWWMKSRHDRSTICDPRRRHDHASTIVRLVRVLQAAWRAMEVCLYARVLI